MNKVVQIPQGRLNNKRVRSQKAQILEYMVNVGPINLFKAIDLFRCTRLQARINDLRNELGHDKIKTTMIKDGRTRYAEYSYVK